MGARTSLLPRRRTEGKRVSGRSAEVVVRVLRATAEEIARVGLEALRIEDVAARSGVNKTTIYRRWPTKSELIGAMLEDGYEAPQDFDLGSLEDDLKASLYDLRSRLESARDRGILQVIQAERTHPDVAAAVRQTRKRFREARSRVFERAVTRGELPATTDVDALVEFVTAPLVARIVHFGVAVEDGFIDLLVRVVCHGARAI